MLELDVPSDLRGHVGTTLGASDWILVDQRMIDMFAAATGDRQWIHVDVDRAAREALGGKTIAHGYLTLSLVPRLADTIYRFRSRPTLVNYGLNRVRFTSAVPVMGRVRLLLTLAALDRIESGTKLTFGYVLELEGSLKPALVAEGIVLATDSTR